MSFNGKSLVNDMKACIKLLEKKKNCNGWAILIGEKPLADGMFDLQIEPTQSARDVLLTMQQIAREAITDLTESKELRKKIKKVSGADSFITINYDGQTNPHSAQGPNQVAIHWHFIDEDNIRYDDLMVFSTDDFETKTSQQIKEELFLGVINVLDYHGLTTKKPNDGDPEFEDLCEALKHAQTNEEMRALHDQIGDIINGLL